MSDCLSSGMTSGICAAMFKHIFDGMCGSMFSGVSGVKSNNMSVVALSVCFLVYLGVR